MAPNPRLSQRHASDPGGPISSRPQSQYSLFAPSQQGGEISSVSRALNSFSFTRHRSVSTIKDDSWGPYGLNLLYSPPEPLVDVIFVHGLRGGSIKTWCKGDDLRLFWPQAWLPREPDLQNVRIHSFGYNADFKDTKETSLDIHDFGRSLFGDMSTSPYLRHDKNTRIMLVGHSMGGLVMKKAYLLAHQDPQAQDIAARIQAMFFLATPHRGSDFAKILNNILRASTVLSSRQYIADLSRNSSSLQLMNDEFRMLTDRLQLWSFYETWKTKVSTSASILVVDRDSAVIGAKDEKVQLLNADHKSMCKFESPSDPNYHVVRNSLAKAVENILGDIIARKADETREVIGSLEFWLDIESFAEDDLANLQSLQEEDTCRWIIGQPTFQNWRDTSDDTLQAYWLTGQPGSGKSIVSAHVVNHLQEFGVDVCYYFFKHGHKEQQTVSGFLRQLAYQMATCHPAIRQRLHVLQESGVVIDKDDARSLWRKLFVNEILKVPLPNQQFWVVDGIDECLDITKLFVMLSKIDAAYPINIFFSSRKIQSLEKHFTSLRSPVFNHNMGPDDTLNDIRSYIERHCGSLAVDIEYRHELVDTIIRKSDGSFLWTKLAFEELEQVYSEDTMSEVLDEIPEGMVALYERVLDSMSRNSREMKLTKAILAWVVCAIRNLTADELQAAMKLDLKSNIPNIERTVDGLCGQMVRIEKNGAVQLIHSTAREFFMDSSLDSPFAIKRSETNERLATVCLEYLCGDELKPPRSRALLSELKSVQSPFADYAATSWSDHMMAASSQSNALLELVERFLKTNVLSWIEYIARRRKNLYYIVRTAKNLRNFLDRRAKYTVPMVKRFDSVGQWATDLLRIVAKFGRNLLLYPSAIYFIIPRLCPTSSSIYQEFGSARSGLALEGFKNTSWGDCISYIDHRDTRAMSLAAGDNVFAIGLKSGYAKVYNGMTCQERTSVHHGEHVRVLKFDHSSQHLVTSGNRSMKMWSVDGELIWSVAHSDPPVSLTFSQDDHLLVACTKGSAIVSRRVMDGIEMAIDPFAGRDLIQTRQFARQAILSSSISPDLRVLAVAYRGRPPQLWSLEKDIEIGRCEKQALSVSQVLFNPNPSVELLAVTYQDGELALFTTWHQEEVASVSGDAYTMSATPDGRTIATGDMLGTIKLWDFETLHLLYCIRSSDYEIRSLAFSGDGLRLFDIRDTMSKVWEPAALVRKTISDCSSASESAGDNEAAPTVGEYGETVAITVMVPENGHVFFGKDDGSVHYHDIASGSTRHLYSHRRDVLPTSISWSPGGRLLLTADATSTVLVRRFDDRWNTSSEMQLTWPQPIRDISLSPDGRHILVHDDDIHLLTLQPRENSLIAIPSEAKLSVHRTTWSKTITGQGTLLAVAEDGLFAMNPTENNDTAGLSAKPPPLRLLDCQERTIPHSVTRMTLNKAGEFLFVEVEDDERVGKVLLYDIRGHPGSEDEEERQIKPIICLKSSDIRCFLGFCGAKVAFLDKNLWVRSYNLTQLPAVNTPDAALGIDQALRHLFVPFELVGANNGVDAAVTEAGDIVFPKEGELAIVREALTWSI